MYSRERLLDWTDAASAFIQDRLGEFSLYFLYYNDCCDFGIYLIDFLSKTDRLFFIIN